MQREGKEPGPGPDIPESLGRGCRRLPSSKTEILTVPSHAVCRAGRLCCESRCVTCIQEPLPWSVATPGSGADPDGGPSSAAGENLQVTFQGTRLQVAGVPLSSPSAEWAP